MYERAGAAWDTDGGLHDRWASARIDALNHALRGPAAGAPNCAITSAGAAGTVRTPPTSRLKEHRGPDACASMSAAIRVEGANPRHEHEWRVWEEVTLPDGHARCMPGVDEPCRPTSWSIRNWWRSASPGWRSWSAASA